MNKKISKAMSFIEFVALNLIWLFWFTGDFDSYKTADAVLTFIAIISSFIVIIGMIVNIIWLVKGVNEKDIDNGMTDIIMGFVSLQFVNFASEFSKWFDGDVEGIKTWLFFLAVILIILGCVNIYILFQWKKENTTETADDIIWRCSCGQENNGYFCTNCDLPRPSHAELQTECVNCGWWTLIGKDKPVVCPKCGSPLMINSCTNCGWKSEPGEKAPDSCPRCGAHFTNKKD